MGNLQTPPNSDKRKFPRFPLDMLVKYQVINRREGETEHLIRKDGQVVNISAGGIAMVTGVALQAGDTLKVELALPGALRATRALAKIAWGEPAAEGRHKSGLSFLMLLNESAENSVAKFLDELKKA